MRVTVLAGTVLLVALANNAGAKSLEDVLKEKGVITEEDYKEVTKSKPVKYTIGNGNGFTFTSSDEKFQLRLGGRLQARYSLLDSDGAGVKNVSEWRIRRMKMWLGGYAYTKNLSYYVQTDFTQSSNVKFIDYAYFNYRLLDEVQLTAGQTKIPFGRQWLTSSAALQFVDRSPVSDSFRPGYDIGVIANGKVMNSLFTYNVGLLGGDGQSIVRTSNNSAFVSRVTINPLGELAPGEGDLEHSAAPKVSFGANYFYDVLQATRTGAATTLETNNLNFAQPRNRATLVNGGWLNRGLNGFTQTEKLNITTFGFDTAFKWMGAFVTGEYLVGLAEGAKSHQKLHATGYYAQAGYTIVPNTFEVAARYSWMDPNRDANNDQASEVAGAVTYFFSKHNLKLQADVADIHDQATGRSDDMQYRVQAQIVF